jgi:7-keto-8-aminopelargonate synthetase-like enzyme
MSLDWLPTELARWDAEGLKRRRRTVTPLGQGWVEVDGRRVLNLAGNDYLGLAEHPDVCAAAIAAIEQSGVGSRASALVSGRTPFHERLERRLAEFEGEKAAVLFPTGYAANVGTICAMVGVDDTVFCDRLNHASLIDGCRLSGAKFRLYKHGDLDGLAADLAAARDRRRRLIVTDAIFSMDGDVAPLDELHKLARRTDSMLLVDEAHATGVLGEHGRGLAEHFQLAGGSTIRVGTLSKAIG